MDDLKASISLKNDAYYDNDSNSLTRPSFESYEKNINCLLLNNLYNRILNISKKKNEQPFIILIDNFNEIFTSNTKSKRSIEIVQSIIKMQSLVK